MTVEWGCKHHADIGVNELYQVLRLRADVFVVEQQCLFQDIDGLDLQGDTTHLMGWQGERLVAYLRLLGPTGRDGEVTIGRVVTAPSARGQGLGNELIAQGIVRAHQLWPHVPLYLSAQAHLQTYYGRHGFVAYGSEYLEDDIAHISMRRVVGT